MTGLGAPEVGAVIVWFRQDLRLADNPAIQSAIGGGQPVIPLFILDETPGVRGHGPAALWWLDKSLRSLASDLQALGSRLILRRGPALDVLSDILRSSGARRVVWSRLYDSGAVARDTALKSALKARGVAAHSVNASLLSEPWALKTKAGEAYQVFTPFMRALRDSVGDFTLHPAPTAFMAPQDWPQSDDLDAWRLHPSAPDWSGGFSIWSPGEAGAHTRLQAFLESELADYARTRDIPAFGGGSRLSPHLHWGEIGPRQVWRAVRLQADRRAGLGSDAEKFLSELGWREFNHQILFHHPGLARDNIKAVFDGFPWITDPEGLLAWKRGRTGYPMVDAGMRELWATGFMHNRVRMIAASFLIKHLLIDWRLGERWFWETLVDADEANNPANWQWVAGSGADAAPFFRIFSPMGQGERFDPDGVYVRRWVPELARLDARYLHAPWTAPLSALEAAGVELGAAYPRPIVRHDTARARALEAFKSLRASSSLV